MYKVFKTLRLIISVDRWDKYIRTEEQDMCMIINQGNADSPKKLTIKQKNESVI